MPTLSSNIVKREIASVEDVERALARQAQYGGDLPTNLLELSNVSEQALATAIAESIGLEPASSGELPPAPAEVRRLVPRDVVQRYGLFPLEQTDGQLIVAVAEVLPQEVLSDLEFSLGLRVVQRATTLIRIEQAIARDYDVALEQRTARVLARLAGQPDPYPSVPATAEQPAAEETLAEVGHLDELANVTAVGNSDAPLTEPRMVTTPAAADSERPVVPDPAAIPTEPPPSPEAAIAKPATTPQLDVMAMARAERRAQRARKRRGPYTIAMAEADLLDADTRDDVVSAFFDFTAQYFEYSALFAIQGDLAEGRDAHGAGASRARVLSLGIPLDLPSTLSQVVESEPYRLARLSASGLDAAFARDLERRVGPLVLLLPIRVRERAVLMLYGDHGTSDITLDSIGEVLSFAPLVSSALTRVILRRKGRAHGTISREELLFGGKRRFHLPEPMRRIERASALASFVESTSRSRPPPAGDEPAPVSVPPLARPVISIGPGAPRPPSVPAPSGAAFSDAPPRPVAPIHSVLPLPSKSRTPIPSSFAPGAPPHPSSEPRNSVPPSVGAFVPPTAADVSEPELLAEPALQPIEDWTQEHFEEISQVAPRSRSIAHSARPLPAPGSAKDLRLPTVIVDLAQDTEELVGKLLHFDETAAERLVEIGPAAVPSLVGAFPGPITSELRRGVGDGPARASECGPLMKVLARIGPKAAGVLSVRTNDKDANVRAWATRLLGEMPCLDAARAVARRFVDEDAEVRRAALAAGRMLQPNPTAGAALADSLSDMLVDSSRRDRLQHLVIEAIADLREARTLPALATLLAAGSPEVQRLAHWALVTIARNDFGDDAVAWDEWWHHNQARHRIEWLIEALMHDNQEIRRAAGDELKSLTKEYFGYYDDLPPRERERAQKRYRDWWESKGKARFSV